MGQVTVTGHSLGASAASVTAVVLNEKDNRLNTTIVVSKIYAFAPFPISLDGPKYKGSGANGLRNDKNPDGVCFDGAIFYNADVEYDRVTTEDGVDAWPFRWRNFLHGFFPESSIPRNWLGTEHIIIDYAFALNMERGFKHIPVLSALQHRLRHTD